MIPLIYKVLSNIATDEERQMLERWIEQSPENREEYEDIKLLCESAQQSIDEKEHGRPVGFEKIREAIRQNAKKRKQRRLLYILASILLLSSIFTYTIPMWNSPDHFTFEDQPLSAVIKSIESKYQLRIDIADKTIMSCRFTGTFYEIELPGPLISSIADAVGAKIEVVGENEYRIVGGRCK